MLPSVLILGVICLAAGFAGGLLSRFWPFTPPVSTSEVGQIVRAINITLVDEQGRERAVLK